MEVLRHSILHLVAPICDACNIRMAWYRSTLIAADRVVVHIFACSGCGRLGEVKTTLKVAK
jgi:hypothetical protein